MSLLNTAHQIELGQEVADSILFNLDTSKEVFIRYWSNQSRNDFSWQYYDDSLSIDNEATIELIKIPNNLNKDEELDFITHHLCFLIGNY